MRAPCPNDVTPAPGASVRAGDMTTRFRPAQRGPRGRRQKTMRKPTLQAVPPRPHTPVRRRTKTREETPLRRPTATQMGAPAVAHVSGAGTGIADAAPARAAAAAAAVAAGDAAATALLVTAASSAGMVPLPARARMQRRVPVTLAKTTCAPITPCPAGTKTPAPHMKNRRMLPGLRPHVVARRPAFETYALWSRRVHQRRTEHRRRPLCALPTARMMRRKRAPARTMTSTMPMPPLLQRTEPPRRWPLMMPQRPTLDRMQPYPRQPPLRFPPSEKSPRQRAPPACPRRRRRLLSRPRDHKKVGIAPFAGDLNRSQGFDNFMWTTRPSGMPWEV